jgi:formate hydrogenlyase transcriptional activator
MESGTLWSELPQRLAPLIDFDFLNLVLCDRRSMAFESHILKPLYPADERGLDSLARFTFASGSALSSHAAMIQDPARFLTSPFMSDLLARYGVQSYRSAPLVSSNDSPLGVLTVGSRRTDAYADSDARLVSGIAFHLAIAYERLMEFGERQIVSEREHDSLLAVREVSDAAVSARDLHQLMSTVSDCIRRYTGAEYADILFYDPSDDCFRRAACLGLSKGHLSEHWVQGMDDSPALTAYRTKQPFIGGREVLERDARRFKQIADILSEGIQEFCCLPLISRDKVLGTLNVGSLGREPLPPTFVEFLRDVARPLTMAVENAVSQIELSSLNEKLHRERSYLLGETKPTPNFKELVGESEVLRSVLRQVSDVADSDATVLILGETGTGKELIARALHDLSSRRTRTYLKINCAALPSGLLESELFGHEKGAFTGAVSRKLGLLELADQGTLFLDEVGDIPLELQPKLLRALQEGEFARIGSNRTIKVDVRLIAATNRDLLQMIEERQYRADLYYRLNVFPITLPSLRERKEDIPLLVRHFTQKFSAGRKEAIKSIPSEAIEALVNWKWPGNIRELQNLIERAVILSKGDVLNVPLRDLQGETYLAPMIPRPLAHESSSETTADVIVRTLRETNGIVSGPRGAAERLGLKRTTLLWRMNRLGIDRKQVLS